MSDTLSAPAFMHDISPDWKGSTPEERRIVQKILPYEETPKAIYEFDRLKKGLGDYWYWFMLGTLWVNYSGFSDLKVWRRLFASNRPGRETSLMKPSELAVYRSLPDEISAFRATRDGITDWISCTMDIGVAMRLSTTRSGPVIPLTVRRSDCIALFLRRSERELLVIP